MGMPYRESILLKLILLFLLLPGLSQSASNDMPITVRVGIYHNPPLVSLGSSGHPRGFFIDILKSIARQEHWRLEYLHGNWSDHLTRLKNGRIDLLPVTAISRERSQHYLFNQETVIVNWGQVFALENSNIKSIPDLDGRTIAVLQKDIYLTGEGGLESICRSFDITCHINTFPSYSLVLKAVAVGQADAGLVNRLYGASEAPYYSPVPTPIVLLPTDLRFAVSREYPQAKTIIEVLDRSLQTMKQDGFSVYHKGLRSLFEKQVAASPSPVWSYELIFFGLLTIVGLSVLVKALKFRVNRKTQELANSEARYRSLFEGASIALWEGNSSRIVKKMRQLIHSGVDNVERYFKDNPDELRSWVDLIGIDNANPATLRLFGVDTVEELRRWLPNAFTPSTYRVLQQTLVAASRKERIFTGEMDLLTVDRRPIRVIISFPITQTLEESCRVPGFMLDITRQRQTETKLTQVIQGASLGFWEWNLLTDEYIVNDQWIEMLDIDKSTLLNHVSDWTQRIHPDDAELTMLQAKQHIEQGTPFNLEFRMLHTNDHWVWIQGSGGVVEYDPVTQQPIRASGTHQDISERKRAEEALHTLLRSMVEITGEDFFERATRELCRWFEVDGANIGELVDNNHITALATIIDDKLVEGFQYPLAGTPCNRVVLDGAQLYPQGVQDLFPSDKDLIILQIEGYAGVPIRDMDGKVIGIVWVVSRKPLHLEPEWMDVMEIIAARISAEIARRRATEQLEHRASYDALTDLPNRRLLLDRLTQTQARCRRHGLKGALLFMDLDHFKNINDSLGHAIGDLLLIEIGKRLRTHIREEDTASRLGGDEFVVLFSELGESRQMVAQQARQLAEKIRASLSEPYTVQDNQLHVTPSIGIVIFPMEEENAETILKHADSAMYRAKTDGRNRLRFYLPGTQQSLEAKLQLLDELQHAVENHELRLYFQPKVDRNGETIGAEALLRWSHPRAGILEPGRFLHAAEESGQIRTICQWVLVEALNLCKTWVMQYPQLQGISVNINSVQFHQAGFTGWVERSLRESDCDPHRLILEIREETLASNLEESKAKIDQLHRLGVRVSIDRYGAGRTSITLLRKIKLDEIKIALGIVAHMISNPNDAKLAQSLLMLAQQMEIDIVAGGVENERQFKLLREQGCRLFQGYYFGRPQPAEQFAATLTKRIATR